MFEENLTNPVGLKNFVATSPRGIPLDFYLYEGKGTSLESALTQTPEKIDVGGRMVMKLTDTLPIGVCVYTDRYFTSIQLIDALLSKRISLVGTIMANRIPKNAVLLKDNELKKLGRASSNKLVRQDGKIILTKWFDSRPVHFASSKCGVKPEGTCTRWSKTDRKYITVKQPAVVAEYNANMGGVDLLDRVIGKYPIRARTNKWTIHTIFHFFYFAVAASWLEYREHAISQNIAKKDVMDYLDFKLSLVFSNNEKATSESDTSDEDDGPPSKQRKVQPLPDKRFSRQGNNHMPTFMKHEQKSRSRCRYSGCGKLTYAKCSSCKVYLCCAVERNCFALFHK